MFNEDEYSSDERAGGAWGVVLALLALGSCANTHPNPDKSSEYIKPNLENRCCVVKNHTALNRYVSEVYTAISSQWLEK